MNLHFERTLHSLSVSCFGGVLISASDMADKDYPKASRIIREAIEVGLVKPHDPNNRSRKHLTFANEHASKSRISYPASRHPGLRNGTN